MKILELILAALAMIGAILMFALVPGGEYLSMISLNLLSILYFIFGFVIFNNVPLRSALGKGMKDISSRAIISGVLSGLAGSINVIGILFKLLSLPGADQMLIIGISLATVLLLVNLVIFFRRKSLASRSTISRLLFFILPGLLLFFTSDLTLIKIRYRNHPRYIEAYARYIEDPHNPAVTDELQKEEMRIYLSPDEFDMYIKTNKQGSDD